MGKISSRTENEKRLEMMGKTLSSFKDTACAIVPPKEYTPIEKGTIFKIPSDFKIFDVPIASIPGKTTLKIVTEEGYEINPKWFVRGGKAVDTGDYIRPTGTAVDAIFASGAVDFDTAFKKVVNKKIVCTSKEEVKTSYGSVLVFGFDFKK